LKASSTGVTVLGIVAAKLKRMESVANLSVVFETEREHRPTGYRVFGWLYERGRNTHAYVTTLQYFGASYPISN
jgi:hypothetical protein